MPWLYLKVCLEKRIKGPPVSYTRAHSIRCRELHKGPRVARILLQGGRTSYYGNTRRPATKIVLLLCNPGLDQAGPAEAE